MSKVIEVRFSSQHGAEELYFSTGFPKKAFLRQPTQDKDRVVWATATKSDNGYEASAPLKAGLIVRVIAGSRKNKSLLFEEAVVAENNGAVYAEKKEHFSDSQLANAASDFAKRFSLRTYDSWAKWLMNESTRHNYSGYSDNWLHFGTVVLQQVAVEELSVMGVPYRIMETEWKHMACEKTWKVYEIMDAKGNIAELCGFAFTV